MENFCRLVRHSHSPPAFLQQPSGSYQWARITPACRKSGNQARLVGRLELRLGLGTRSLPASEGYMPQTLLFCPLFSPQSQLTNRFRLMFSTAEVCNIWEHKLSVYKWRAVRHTIPIQSDTILRKSLKGFSKQQPSQHCLWKRALLHCHTTMYRNVLIQDRFFSESTNMTLIQVLLNKTSFFTFQLDTNWPKCSIQNLYWCTFLKHLIPTPVECPAGNVSVLSNMPGQR